MTKNRRTIVAMEVVILSNSIVINIINKNAYFIRTQFGALFKVHTPFISIRSINKHHRASGLSINSNPAFESKLPLSESWWAPFCHSSEQLK